MEGLTLERVMSLLHRRTTVGVLHLTGNIPLRFGPMTDDVDCGILTGDDGTTTYVFNATGTPITAYENARVSTRIDFRDTTSVRDDALTDRQYAALTNITFAKTNGSARG